MTRAQAPRHQLRKHTRLGALLGGHKIGSPTARPAATRCKNSLFHLCLQVAHSLWYLSHPRTFCFASPNPAKPKHTTKTTTSNSLMLVAEYVALLPSSLAARGRKEETWRTQVLGSLPSYMTPTKSLGHSSGRANSTFLPLGRREGKHPEDRKQAERSLTLWFRDGALSSSAVFAVYITDSLGKVNRKGTGSPHGAPPTWRTPWDWT